MKPKRRNPGPPDEDGGSVHVRIVKKRKKSVDRTKGGSGWIVLGWVGIALLGIGFLLPGLDGGLNWLLDDIHTGRMSSEGPDHNLLLFIVFLAAMIVSVVLLVLKKPLPLYFPSLSILFGLVFGLIMGHHQSSKIKKEIAQRREIMNALEKARGYDYHAPVYEEEAKKEGRKTASPTKTSSRFTFPIGLVAFCLGALALLASPIVAQVAMKKELT